MKNSQDKNFSSQSVFHSISSKGSSSRRVQTDTSYSLKTAPLPRKVLVLGKINQLGIDEGNGKTKIIFSRDDPPTPTHNHKSKKHHILIPVKQEGYRTEFIKVPIYKVAKFPPSDDAGNVEISKLSPSGNEINVEKVQKYATSKDQFGERLMPGYHEDYKTEFIFQEPETIASDITQVSRTESQPKKIVRSSMKSPDRFDKTTNTSEEELEERPSKKPEIKPLEKQPEKEKKKFRSKCWKKRELKRLQREKEAREREAKRQEEAENEESALMREREKNKKLEKEVEKCKKEREKDRREKERKKSSGTKDSTSTKESLRDENLKRKSSSAASSAFEIEPNPDSKVLPYLVTNKKKKRS